MIDVKRDFEERVEEIELYFEFIENLVEKDAKLIYPDKSEKEFDDDLVKIFKANSFLLLYNLCESCIPNAVEAIYLKVNTDGVNFDKLRSEFKIEIIKFLKSANSAKPKDFVGRINNIAQGIILECFKKEKLFPGNIDADKISELARKYGFSSSCTFVINSDGSRSNIKRSNLRTVRRKRNELAHGTYSFKECGKDYTIPDLIEIKNHVVEYLRQILNNIEQYIINQEYLVS
ncbi:MAG: MAE_28990/MAE_18760 family HEPN-like nuclease [Bacteroidota bacterium]